MVCGMWYAACGMWYMVCGRDSNERPLVVVGSALTDLGRQVVGGTNAGPGQLYCATTTAGEREPQQERERECSQQAV